MTAVLFDAGGVLLRLDYAAIAGRAAEHGFPIEAETLAHAEARARREIDARAARHGAVPGTDATRVPDYFDDLLAAAGMPDALRPQVVGRLRADNREAGLWRVPLEGALETLASLRRAGLRTGVVSNADGRARLLLEQAGLAASFDVILDSHFEGVEKPDPEIFRRALARLGVGAAQAVFVGDIWSIDVEGSRAAGLRPILMDVTGGYADRDCERIAGLVELCDRLGLGPGLRRGEART